MTAAERNSLISVEDYLAGELTSDMKHEYLGGYVYAMAGAKTKHNRIATNFTIAIGSQLRGALCETFNSDMKVRIKSANQTRFYYPDGMVVCSPNEPDEAFQDQPVVIAEVLSEATRRLDEGEKREAYLSIPSLQVYLLVDQDHPRVVAYRRGDQGFEAELYEGFDIQLPLDEIEASLAFADLYERITFSD